MSEMISVLLDKKIRYAIFLLFTLDLLLLGAGKNLPALGISSRKVFFVLFAMISIVVFVAEYSNRRLTDAALFCGAAIFLLVWVVLIPALTHGNIAYAVTDSTPLAALAIFLVSTEFARYTIGWIWVRRLMITFLCAFAILHIVLYVFLLVYPQMQSVLSDLFQYVFDVGSGDDARFVFFTPSLGNGIYRIYFGSSFLLLLGLYFSVIRSTKMRLGWLRLEYVMALLILGALWATNTRSLMLGAVTFIGLYPFCLAFFKHTEQSYWSIFLLLALPIVSSFLLVPTVDPTTLQLIGLGRSVNDDVRAVQFASLFDAFKNNPLFGLGFGSNAAFIRAQDTPYAYELSIVGLLMKIGTVGLLTACAIWAGVLDTFRSPGNKRAVREVAALYALYFSFVFSCFYNPYIFGFFGTFFLLFVLYEFSYVMREAEND
ncbi:O-antigen ligase family protein [Paraburkholderia azotifigens]|uniref:O-antigen ligase family protein n=1 Tax=Paraburkholderia azotifigens TaxID=2057004 RepID=A0A5C6VTM2_9BURK|nr:O-antigen ligase family protein [Paraburkholderia azotifigens]TXC88842.1 hypothetical protein FRZ40_15290 [Paraburkholderia azotifigens]